MTAIRTRQHARNIEALVLPNTTIDRLADEALTIARSFGSYRPSEAATRTLQLHNRVQTAIDQTRRPVQQQRLYFILAQAAALLSSASVDLGLWPTAMSYASATAEYGKIIGHSGVLAYARGMQSTIAFWTGQASEAVGYAQAAVEVAPIGVATVRAQSVLARAWAHRGAVEQVRHAVRAADDARTVEGTDELHDEVGGELGFNEPRLARNTSTAWLQVDRPLEAMAAAQVAVQLLLRQQNPVWGTLQAEACLDLATCQLIGGQADAAEETLAQAETTLAPLWQMPADWKRIGVLGRVERLRMLLAAPQWRGVAVARNLADTAANFAAVGPTPPPPLPSA
jgi:hypothetical protein